MLRRSESLAGSASRLARKAFQKSKSSQVFPPATQVRAGTIWLSCVYPCSGAPYSTEPQEAKNGSTVARSMTIAIKTIPIQAVRQRPAFHTPEKCRLGLRSGLDLLCYFFP